MTADGEAILKYLHQQQRAQVASLSRQNTAAALSIKLVELFLSSENLELLREVGPARIGKTTFRRLTVDGRARITHGKRLLCECVTGRKASLSIALGIIY